MRRLLVLRPEPGASRTVEAARAAGLEAIAAPLFTTEPVGWAMPAGDFDALMLTSANAVRMWAMPAAVRALPVYAVGAATAAAARAAGLEVVLSGFGDAEDLLAAMAAAGIRRALHLAGEVRREIEYPPVEVIRVIVYRMVPVDQLPAAACAALDDGAVAMLHSPAAARLFARLAEGLDRSAIALAAISAAAAAAAGKGWANVVAAAYPTDAALLAVAAQLCEEAPQGANG